MESYPEELVAHCLNCGEPITKRFCPECGQEATRSATPLRKLLSELADHLFSFDSKLFATLRILLTKPGMLTTEYLEGRRQRYLAPFRIYVTMSAIFFLLLGFRTRVIPTYTASPIIHVNAPGVLTTNSFEGLPDSVTELEHKVEAQGKKLNLVDHYLLRQVVQLKKVGVKGLVDKLIGNLPLMMFLLLLLFACALKLVYWRSGRLYTEHLIFLLHCHALSYLALCLEFVPQGRLWTPLITIWLGTYFFLAMHRVYRQSIGKTLVKMALLSGFYAAIFLVCLMVVSIIAFLQT